MKILYVEDNDDNVYMLKNRLARAGFAVIVATDGAQGVAMAASEQPDLVLMDLTLPVIDGEEATRRIKANSATRHIPVIALTANAMTGDREKAIAAGCDDFDTKPVECSDCSARSAHSRRRGTRRERRRRCAARRGRHRGQSLRADTTARPSRLSNVTTAADGRQAIELLNSKPFDLVLLDIMMPNLNGYEVLAEMKANSSLGTSPSS